jgi:phage tail-like protein
MTGPGTGATGVSRRGAIDGLGSPQPLGTQLPAAFADDWLVQQFTGGIDEVLAPFLAVLDCLDAYFAPGLAPLDFTRWIGAWIGAETDTDAGSGQGRAPLPEPRLRAAVAAAARLHRIRGTRHGLAETVRLAFGAVPEITESGAATWSARPRGAFPGEGRPRLYVALTLPDPTPADTHRLDALVAAARPAHMPYTVQVTAPEGSTER